NYIISQERDQKFCANSPRLLRNAYWLRAQEKIGRDPTEARPTNKLASLGKKEKFFLPLQAWSKGKGS
ncbi:MAG: hypothetical protein ACUVWQ_11745, partial [Candidatus Aminicenantales bacterium]